MSVSDHKDLAPVVSQAKLASQYYNRKQHIKDADEKSIQELVKNMLDDVPGAYLPFELRMQFRRSEDYVFLMQQYEVILKEEKECGSSGKSLSASKFYFLGKVHAHLLPKDERTRQHLKKAANLGHPGALNWLGLNCPEQAPECFEKAAVAGDYVAEWRLAEYYFDLYKSSFSSYLLNTYLEKAKKYYDSAAGKGYELAQFMIGFLNGVDKWPHKQAPYFVRQSAETFYFLSQKGDANSKRYKDQAIKHLRVQYRNVTTLFYYVDRFKYEGKKSSCIYHSTMGLTHLKKYEKEIKFPQELLSAFCELAKNQPNEFLTLCKNDPWENVFPLLPADTARKLMDLDASLTLPKEFTRAEIELKEKPKENVKTTMTVVTDLKDPVTQVTPATSFSNASQASVATASTSIWEPLNTANAIQENNRLRTVVGSWKKPI